MEIYEGNLGGLLLARFPAGPHRSSWVSWVGKPGHCCADGCGMVIGRYRRSDYRGAPHLFNGSNPKDGVCTVYLIRDHVVFFLFLILVAL